jgi:hypothetical protein
MGKSVEMESWAASSLARVISPLSTEEFLTRYCSKSFVHIAGWPGKFSNLLPWPRLNEMLSYHQFPAENLRVFKNGKQISPEKYVLLPSRPRRLDAAELTNLLAEGATLALSYVDDLDPVVRNFVVGLERIFRNGVWANLYAGWRSDFGFDLHWDDHHTMILQVSGRKRWQVYSSTRLYPSWEEAEETPRPTEPPIWEGILEEGGFLHIPSGWWHVACPLNEPSLHLTVGFKDPAGINLFRWLGNRLIASAIARQDIPHSAEGEEQSTYLAELWKAIQNDWTPDLLDRFMASVEGTAPPRPELELPFAATPDGLMLEKDSTIRLTPPCRLDLSGTPQDGTLSFRTFRRSWQCPEVVLPALRALNDGEPHRIDELRALAADSSGSFAIHGFISALILDGVVTKVDVVPARTEFHTEEPG